MNITGIGTVAIPVSDQDRALAFYTERLGFEVRTDMTYGEDRWIEVAPPDATTTAALSPVGEDGSVGIETKISLTTTDVDTDHSILLDAEVEVEDVIRMDGVPPMFYFRDADGNRLLIIQSH